MRWLVFGLALLALACLFRPVVEGDAVGYFAYEHSLVFDHDLNFSDEYAAAKAAGVTLYLDNIDPRTATGLPVNFQPVGSALMAMPFYLVAVALHPSGVPQWAAPFTTAIAAASLLYGLLALALSYALARRSLVATLATLTATPLLYYLTAEPGYSHTFSVFASALFAVVWWRSPDRSPAGWFLLGLLGGFMGAVRIQDGALAVIAVLDLPRARLRALAMLPGLLLGFLPQLIAEKVIFGTWTPGRGQFSILEWFPGHYLQVLFSSHNGLFAWTPIALVAVAGWFLLEDRRLRAACLLGLAVEVVVAGTQGDWWGGQAFGMRRLLDLTPFFAVGLAAVARRLRPALAWAAAGALTAWNLLLMANYSYVIRVDRDPGYLGLLAGQLKALPDLPRVLLQGDVVRDLLLFRAAHRPFDPLAGVLLLAIEAACLAAALAAADNLAKRLGGEHG